MDLFDNAVRPTPGEAHIIHKSEQIKPEDARTTGKTLLLKKLISNAWDPNQIEQNATRLIQIMRWKMDKSMEIMIGLTKAAWSWFTCSTFGSLVTQSRVTKGRSAENSCTKFETNSVHLGLYY